MPFGIPAEIEAHFAADVQVFAARFDDEIRDAGYEQEAVAGDGLPQDQPAGGQQPPR